MNVISSYPKPYLKTSPKNNQRCYTIKFFPTPYFVLKMTRHSFRSPPPLNTLRGKHHLRGSQKKSSESFGTSATGRWWYIDGTALRGSQKIYIHISTYIYIYISSCIDVYVFTYIYIWILVKTSFFWIYLKETGHSKEPARYDCDTGPSR